MADDDGAGSGGLTIGGGDDAGALAKRGNADVVVLADRFDAEEAFVIAPLDISAIGTDVGVEIEGLADAIIAIGCVIKGDTPHFDYVCQAATQGIAQINAKGTTPVIFSVLTTLDQQQALDRAGGRLGNKGVEGAVTAIKIQKLILISLRYNII